MRRALVADDDATGAFGLALGLALHEHRHALLQLADFGCLARDHVREVVCDALKMRDLFFEVLHVLVIAPEAGAPSIACPSGDCALRARATGSEI